MGGETGEVGGGGCGAGDRGGGEGRGRTSGRGGGSREEYIKVGGERRETGGKIFPGYI